MIQHIRKIGYYYFHHLGLYKKLMAAFGTIIIITVLVLYFFSYSRIATILESNILYSANQSYEQTYSYASYKLYRMLRTSDLIFNNQMVHSVLKTDVNSTTVIEQVDGMLSLQSYLTSFEDSEDINLVKLYVPSDFLFANEGVNFGNLGSVEHTTWYDKLDPGANQPLFALSSYLEDKDNSQLAIIRPIYNLDNFLQIEGFLEIDFNKSILTDIINRSNPIDNSYTLIINDALMPVLSSNEILQSKYPIDPQIIHSSDLPDRTYELREFENNALYIQSRLISNTDWYIISVIPREEIITSVNKQRNVLLVALIFMLVFAFVIAYFISIYITKRLDQLTEQMRNPVVDFSLPLQLTDDQDEIGQLAKSYQVMHNKIESLMEDQYLAGQSLKSAELRALQTQINPHFLYNTLEMINWMAKKRETEQILKVTRALSKFYKLSLSKGNDQISLRNEFAHVNAYINIQNQRFEDHIHFEQYLAPEVADYIVPKIILQPLVENAIHHGILEKDIPEGTLVIEAKLIDNAIKLTVQDNGVGITQKELLHLFDAEAQSNSGSHYGLYSIKERLRLYYNDQSTIEVNSEPGEGTTITINLPYSKDESQ